MFLIPWKIHFLINKKLGVPISEDIQHNADNITLTLIWKKWGLSKYLHIVFNDKGVEWNDRKDKTLRYSYGYEKMGSFDGYPVLIIDEKMNITKGTNTLWDNYVIQSVELFSKNHYERMLTKDLTVIPEFKDTQ